MSGQKEMEPDDAHLVASPESVERTGRSHAGAWISAMAAGLAAGAVIGWAARGTVSSREGFVTGADRASTNGSKNIAEDHVAPFTFQSPAVDEKAAPKPSRGLAAPPVPPAKEVRPAPSKPVAVLPKAPPTLSGSLAPVTPLITAASPASPDLHSAEAKVRTIAADLGAQVVDVHDARGTADSAARSMVLSIAPARVDELSKRVRKALGTAAMVEAPVHSIDTADDTPSIELRSEETVLEQLKQKLRQATLDFYPDAPALKSLQAQYADQLKKVEGLRRSGSGPVSVTIVLIGTSG